MKLTKLLFLCLAVPLAVIFILCVVLPILLIMILLSALFAPHRLKGTFQHIRTYHTQKKAPQPADSGEIDVECTVLETKEISKDS